MQPLTVLPLSLSLPPAVRVSVPQVARVLSEVYGDRMASSGSSCDGESFPLQQKLLVCCLLLLTRSGKSREIPLGKVSGHFMARGCEGVCGHDV